MLHTPDLSNTPSPEALRRKYTSLNSISMIESKQQAEHIPKPPSFLLQTSLQGLLDMFSKHEGEKAIHLEKRLFMDCPFRKYRITELHRDERSIEEHVQVSIPIEFENPIINEKCMISTTRFILKTFLDGYNQYCVNEREVLFNASVQRLNNFPILFYFNDTMSLVMENIGQSFSDLKFTCEQLIQACTCVHTLHTKLMYIHNDVKESNFTIRLAVTSKENKDEKYVSLILKAFQGKIKSPTTLSTHKAMKTLSQNHQRFGMISFV